MTKKSTTNEFMNFVYNNEENNKCRVNLAALPRYP